jgi:hypothetical protein
MASPTLSAKTTTLVGAAGEYLVLSRLCLHGFIAAPAPKGVPNADVLVTDVSGSRLYAVQVKTRTFDGGDRGWHMGKKHEEIISETLLYCFVDFADGPTNAAVIYVVPSKVVATVLREMHQVWLANPGKRGQKHNDNDMRRFMPD